MQHAVTTIAIAIFSAAPTPLSKEAAEQIKALEARIEAIKRDVRDPLRAEYERRKAVLVKEADLNHLRFDIDRAKKAYELRKVGDAGILATRRAAEQATKSLPLITKDRVENNPRVVAMTREMEAIRAYYPQIAKMQSELRKKLMVIRRELNDAPEVQAARQALRDAEKAYAEFSYKHPKVLAARAARDEARKVLEAKGRELPERKAYEEASAAYEKLKTTSPEMAKARGARDAVRKAYEAKLQKAVAEGPKGLAIQKQIEQFQQREKDADAEQIELRKQLAALRAEVGKSDAVKPSREACEAANKAYYEAYNNGPKISAARKARDEAREAYGKQKTPESKKAYEDADRIYQGLKTTDPDIVRTKAERDKAYKVYSRKLTEAVGADKNGAALTRQLAKSLKIENKAEEKQRDLKKQLYALRAELGKSPELAKDRAAIQAADKAYADLPKTHPTFLAAAKRRDEARAAWEAKIKTLPEQQAVVEADKAYDFVRREGPEYQQARAARDAARKASEAKLDDLYRNGAKAAPLHREILQLDSDREGGQARYRQLSQEIASLRRDIHKNDPEIQRAHQAVKETREAHNKAMKDRLADEQKAISEATKALEAQIARKCAADVFIRDIGDRIKKAEDEMGYLYKQIKAIRYPGKKPDSHKDSRSDRDRRSSKKSYHHKRSR